MCAIKFSSVFFVAILCKSVISMQISSPRTPRHIHLHIHRKTSAEDCGNSSSKFTDVLLHDPITRNQLLSPVVSWMPSDQYGSHHQQHVTVVPLGSRQPSILQPCTCANLNCGCCVYMNIPRLGYQREYCANLTYHPNAFAIEMNVLRDEHSIYQNQMSARNPSPLCLPVPYMPLDVDMCVKLFNIFTPGRNLHVCMDFQTRVQHSPVLVLHFDCMRMGANGVALVKPFQNGGLDLAQVEEEQQGNSQSDSQEDADNFDEVTEVF